MKQARRSPAPRPVAPGLGPPIGPRLSDRACAVPAVVIFVAALALRLIHVWQLRSSPFFDVLLGDAHGYDEWAQRIAGGDWIGHDVFYQAPLYPYFLGLIYRFAGHSVLAVRLVQAIVGAASCALLVLAGHRSFSRTAGIAAGVGLAVYAPAIFFDGLLQKSVLDVFFLSLALWLVSRVLDSQGSSPEWLSLGLSMGALSLTRENALVFIVAILGWILWRRLPSVTAGRRAATVATFAVGLAIVLVPVALRNHAVGGGFYLTTSQFGPNLYIGNNPKSDGTYMSLRYGRGAPEYERQDATELAEHAAGHSLTPAEVSSYWTTRATDFITGQPRAWLRLTGRKFLLLWNAGEMLDTESQESYAEFSTPLRLLGWFGHFGVLVPLALAGALCAWPHRRRVGVLFAMTVLYASSVILFYVFARYRLPLVPLLLLFAGEAVAALVAASRPHLFADVRSHPAAAACVIASAIFANWPVLSSSLMKAITENNLATALQAGGRSAEAIAHYERAIAIRPDYAPAYNNLGVAQRTSGQIDQAIASYRRAIATQSDYPDAHYNLANALLDKQQPREAGEHFEIALRSIPDSAGIRNNLGIALAAQGRGADAIASFRAAVASEPNSARAQHNLGSALADAGRIDEAIAALTRATILDQRDAAGYYDLGVVLLENGKAEAAAAAFRSSLQLNPRSAESHNNLGIALGTLGRLGEAIAEFERALAITPGYEDARTNLAMARQRRR